MRLVILILASIFNAVVPGNGLSTPQRQHTDFHQLAIEASSTTRRNTLVTGLGSVAAIFLGNPSNAAAATGGRGSAFVGTYSDPINHPGGKRTINLLPTKVGDYQLAEVVGGGGVGEPKSYVLPAIVIGDRTIIIDFSPKGGPRDFTGVLEGKNIKFIRDGNTWPRID
jgi:hypothetical protein